MAARRPRASSSFQLCSVAHFFLSAACLADAFLSAAFLSAVFFCQGSSNLSPLMPHSPCSSSKQQQAAASSSKQRRPDNG